MARRKLCRTLLQVTRSRSTTPARPRTRFLVSVLMYADGKRRRKGKGAAGEGRSSAFMTLQTKRVAAMNEPLNRTHYLVSPRIIHCLAAYSVYSYVPSMPFRSAVCISILVCSSFWHGMEMEHIARHSQFTLCTVRFCICALRYTSSLFSLLYLLSLYACRPAVSVPPY
jgi:hypothetical protein